jgi:hypothetical protein
LQYYKQSPSIGTAAAAAATIWKHFSRWSRLPNM